MITSKDLRKLASLNLSAEQMIGVLELLADKEEREEKRKEKQRERKQRSRAKKCDGHVTVTVTKTKKEKEKRTKKEKEKTLSPKEKTPKGVKKKGGFPLPVWIPPDTWLNFEEHRKKLRKPMTDYARLLIFGKLERARAKGHDPTDMLETAIERGWQSVFEPTDGRKDHEKNKPDYQSRSQRADVAIAGSLRQLEEDGFFET